MKVFRLSLVFSALISSSCSIIPHSDFNVSRKNNHKDFKEISIQFIEEYPDKKYSIFYSGENLQNAPGYVNNFSLSSDLKNCKIYINHEIIYDQTSLYVQAMEGLTIGTLGIVPYRVDLMFKTKMKLTSGEKIIEKEMVSEEMSYRLGLIYIPMFIGGIFESGVTFTNNITAKMYAYQISKLADELKDFKCE